MYGIEEKRETTYEGKEGKKDDGGNSAGRATIPFLSLSLHIVRKKRLRAYAEKCVPFA